MKKVLLQAVFRVIFRNVLDWALHSRSFGEFQRRVSRSLRGCLAMMVLGCVALVSVLGAVMWLLSQA